MDGYIQSKKTSWVHIFKMSIRPGGKIPLADLYEMYGKKHSIAEKDFIDWLKNVKLKGKIDDWLIVEKAPDYSSEEVVVEDKEEYVTDNRGDVVARKMSVEDIVELPVRKAREVIPRVMDEKLLRYALQEAKPKPNKDSLCRILEKRITELKSNIS